LGRILSRLKKGFAKRAVRPQGKAIRPEAQSRKRCFGFGGPPLGRPKRAGKKKKNPGGSNQNRPGDMGARCKIKFGGGNSLGTGGSGPTLLTALGRCCPFGRSVSRVGPGIVLCWEFSGAWLRGGCGHPGPPAGFPDFFLLETAGGPCPLRKKGRNVLAGL